MKSLHLLAILGAATLPAAHSATVLIDKTFDGNNANDTGPAFQQLTNGLGTGGSSNLTTGVVTTGTGNINSNYGYNNSSLVAIPGGTTSITATFVVTAAPASVSTLAANGLFFGLVSGALADNPTSATSTGLYQSDPMAFGYVAGSVNWGDHVILQDKDELTSSLTTTLPSVPTNASFQDGFTVTLTLRNDDTWSILTNGLSTNATGMGSYAGTLDTGANGFSYATFLANGVGLNTTLQNGGQSYTVSQMTLTAIPEPGAALLGSLGFFALLRRRR